uniref:Uncharacterized protein n=1 Tax=Arundo donax TaxID=35708 RepID=A0A0A9DB53_ARUDO
MEDKRGRCIGLADKHRPARPWSSGFWPCARCSRRSQEMLDRWKRSCGLRREILGATLPICPSVGELALALSSSDKYLVFMLHGFPRINLVFSKDARIVSTD